MVELKSTEDYLLLHEERLLAAIDNANKNISKNYLFTFSIMFLVFVILKTNSISEISIFGMKLNGASIETFFCLSILIVFFASQVYEQIVKLSKLYLDLIHNSLKLKKSNDNYKSISLKDVNLYGNGYFNSFMSFINQLFNLWSYLSKSVKANHSNRKILRILKPCANFTLGSVFVIAFIFLLLFFFVLPFAFVIYIWFYDLASLQSNSNSGITIVILQSIFTLINGLLILYSSHAYLTIINIYLPIKLEDGENRGFLKRGVIKLNDFYLKKINVYR